MTEQQPAGDSDSGADASGRSLRRDGGAVAVGALRLAARAVRPRAVAAPTRACSTARGCSPTTSSTEMIGALDGLEADVALGRLPAVGPPTRTCTPRSSAGSPSGSASSAASCAPAARATTRWPPTSGSSCATTPASSRLAVVDLQRALLEQARRHVDTAAPGFTHLQHAQPVSFGHELAKHVHAFARDVDRLRDWDHRAALSPMGAGALAGSSLPLDPQAVAARARLPRRRRQLDRRRERPRLRRRAAASSPR